MSLEEQCVGCGKLLPVIDGPTHKYMLSSPACYAAFNQILAAEYSSQELMEVHRLTVDTYAVQHPGDPSDRRAVQSVGLHLARLFVQLESPRPPKETNQVMLDFASNKSSLIALKPPKQFRVTAADIAPFAGTGLHAAKVKEWASTTWEDWSAHHDYIREWVKLNSSR